MWNHWHNGNLISYKIRVSFSYLVSHSCSNFLKLETGDYWPVTKYIGSFFVAVVLFCFFTELFERQHFTWDLFLNKSTREYKFWHLDPLLMMTPHPWICLCSNTVIDSILLLQHQYCEEFASDFVGDNWQEWTLLANHFNWGVVCLSGILQKSWLPGSTSMENAEVTMSK